MTNKYLEKLAASKADEMDAAKTYAKATGAGWAGYLGGAALGGLAGVALTASGKGKALGGAIKNTKVVSKLTSGVKNFAGKVGNSDFVQKYKHTLAAGGVGAIVGSHMGEESAHYAATRQGVIDAKNNARQEKRAMVMDKIAEILTRN